MATDKDQRHVDREAEQKRQQDVEDAVTRATREKDGTPIQLPQPPDVKVFGGKA